MSPSRKPDGRSHQDEKSTAKKVGEQEESTYRLAAESPIPPGGIIPPPPVDAVFSKRTSRSRGYTPYRSGTLVGCNTLVFITNICVMTLELTATRLIAKHVGSSLYTWTSVIGVILAGMTLGNWLGGWMADRFDRHRTLGWMYLLGSISCGGVLWLDQLVAATPRPDALSWPAWVVTVVASIFLLPALALGTTSPLVASIAIDRSSKTGAAVGNIYAWGALGSIVGTFLTGFYLIDVWGTRSIIGLTSGTLGILAILVVGSRGVFRTGVLLGWLQLLGWTLLVATATGDGCATVALAAANFVNSATTIVDANVMRNKCSVIGRNIGEKLHEFGLILSLRDDQIHQYRDESNYSDISVSDTIDEGRRVKSLKLDKLIHSYYDPNNPTALHYEYEQIYAAVTKNVAWRGLATPLTVSINLFPTGVLATDNFPPGVIIDEVSQTLRIDRPSNTVFAALLAMAPEADYWTALEELQQATNKQNWGGFSSVKLTGLPQGAVIPEEIREGLRYDQSLSVLIAYQPITLDVRDRLIANTLSGKWYQKIQELRHQTGRFSACFYGGGGYVFPRWFLEEFPESAPIDVAELDPAVLTVVTKELGFTEEHSRRIATTIGDARNFVDDRLRDNFYRKQSSKMPVTYDFIYGDAFNDFSIPWHLTTVEFLQKTHDLLSDNGVFQANIIDKYPRTEFPGTTAVKSEVEYHGRLPNGVVTQEIHRDVRIPAANGFIPLEVLERLTNRYQLYTSRAISEFQEKRLNDVTWPDVKSSVDPLISKGVVPAIDVASERSGWKKAISDLASMSRMKQAFEGTIPAVLMLSDGPINEWQSSKSEFEFVESLLLGNGKRVLGFRGRIDEENKDKLIRLDPQNTEWCRAVKTSCARSKETGPGRFLGCYVATAVRVFPNVYLFSTSRQQPDAGRDTFVMVCSKKTIDLSSLKDTGDWEGVPFASIETLPGNGERKLGGQMCTVLALAEGRILTDDFAPVDNLLVPVFNSQE